MHKYFIVIIVMLSVVTHANAEKSKKGQPDKDAELCELNANIDGYLTIITNECGYELSNHQSQEFLQINKVCVEKYGNTRIFNSSMGGIHEAKKDLAEHERSDVCSGVYKAYKRFFE